MTNDLRNGETGTVHAFKMASLDGSFRKPPTYSVGPCLRLLIACLATLVVVTACGWSPPVWFQPTEVGVLWASLFLVGAAAGSVRRGNGLFATMAGGYVWLSQLAMQSLTSLVAAECGLVVVCIFSAGWLVTQLEYSGRSLQTPTSDVRRYKQWTIWDLALLTTLVAVICYALPRLESPIALLGQVGFVLWGGCLCGWVAYRWVFDDHWTLIKLGALLAVSGLCLGLLSVGLISRQTPVDFSLLHIATWMLTGPIAVVAAQALTVLVLLTAIRIDQGSLNTPKRFVLRISGT